MYKLLVAASLLTSAVNGQSYGASSYGSSSGGMSGGSSYQAPKADMGSSYQAPKADMSSSYQAPKAEAPKADMSSSYQAPKADMSSSYQAPKQDMGSSYMPPSEAKPSQPCASGGVHDVMVGGSAGLLYTPSSIMANVGDKVRFHFLMKNHTVTQSTFDKPCVKKQGGQDSSFKPSMLKDASEAKGKEDANLIWEYKVESMDPTWWYCKQKTGTHCGKGMVFAINPTADKSFDKFKMVAQQQNGTADGGMMPPPPPPPSSPPSSPPPPPAMAAGYNAGSGGACSCQCLCGVASFPQGSGWGNAMQSGYPGVASAPWASMSSAPTPASAYAAPAQTSSASSGGSYAPPAAGGSY